MIRSQILLEEWHYRELKKLAARENTSLSAAVRHLLAKLLKSDPAEKERLKIVGMIKSAPTSARDHDKYIYREDRRDK